MRGLRGKVAVVTGCAGALGAATARRLLEEGVLVMGADVNAEALGSTAEALASTSFSTIAVDLAGEQGVSELVRHSVARFGRIDLLANALGILGPVDPIASSSLDDLDAIYRANVRAVFLVMRATIQQFLAQGSGGSILNFASVAALRARPERSFYGLSKRAVVALTSSAAMEYASRGIRINCVAPGPIDSPMFQQLAAAASKAWDASTIPLGRLGRPEDVASMAAFLLSDDAAFCTGGLYLVDGGASL